MSITSYSATLVGADYQMKRFAMGFDQSPVRGMPSFLQLSSGKGNNMFPRWWLTTNYEPLLKSADGNAWELCGQPVQLVEEGICGARSAAVGTIASARPTSAVPLITARPPESC